MEKIPLWIPFWHFCTNEMGAEGSGMNKHERNKVWMFLFFYLRKIKDSGLPRIHTTQKNRKPRFPTELLCNPTAPCGPTYSSRFTRRLSQTLAVFGSENNNLGPLQLPLLSLENKNKQAHNINSSHIHNSHSPQSLSPSFWGSPAQKKSFTIGTGKTGKQGQL